ncbi:thermonuclease family protein [Candidatus Pacearchaeota archaeon]|nr:thermonuclease family protein [Candidatus Pacearchaeota archaeon]
MDRKHALILSFFITSIIAGNFLFFTDEGIVRENVEIARVLDGDTVELSDGRKIRLLNINTPEKGLPYSNLAKEFLSNFTFVGLETSGLDKYDRTLGRLYNNNEYLNLEIVRNGMAHSYLVLDDESSLFEKAENSARKNGKNMWEKSPFAECLDVEINKYDEYVDIEDSCDVDFTGWNVKDESTKMYKFKKDFDKSIRLHSTKGRDTESDIYWGRDKIWNDDHDEIFVRDVDGLLVYYYSYG